MSRIASWRDHPLVERVGYHAARVGAWARRATPSGLAVRGAVWLTGSGALLLASSPPARLLVALPVAAVAALLPAAGPGSRWVGLLEIVVVGLLAVRLATDPPPWSPLLAGLLGILLYAHHSAAALAAQLRTDTVIPAAVLRHWATRAGAVLAASAVLGAGILVLPAPATWSATGFLALGAAAASAVAAVLVRLARRPDIV